MKAIVAVDSLWGIGKQNDLLFSIPEDMKFFRTTTLNKIVVMGGKTLRSFPGGKPLKNRINIVLSKNTLPSEGCVVVGSFEELLAEIKKYPAEEVYVIGGGSIYSALLPYCSGALVTKVKADGGAQVFFPNLDNLEGWKLISESEVMESNGYKFTFCEYQNTEIKK